MQGLFEISRVVMMDPQMPVAEPTSDLHSTMKKLCPDMKTIRDVYSAFVVSQDWPLSLTYRQAYNALAELDATDEYEEELYKLMALFLSYYGFDGSAQNYREMQKLNIQFIEKYHNESPE